MVKKRKLSEVLSLLGMCGEWVCLAETGASFSDLYDRCTVPDLYWVVCKLKDKGYTIPGYWEINHLYGYRWDYRGNPIYTDEQKAPKVARDMVPLADILRGLDWYVAEHMQCVALGSRDA